MNTTLPGITVFMLGSFNFLRTKFLLIIAFVVAAFFLIKKYIQTPIGRRHYEAALFRMPVFGDVVRLIIVEKFTSQMAILVDTGVPILYALEIAERLVDNVICGEIIKDIRDAVKEGKLLSEPMEKSGFFPPMAVQMIRVGEETGELAKMLNHVAAYYKATVEEFMKRLGTLIEPFMLVFMGSVIGLIVVSMFLPLFSLAGG